jgi:hypothetical protein
MESTRMSRMLAVMVLLVWPAALVFAQQSPPESESDAPPRATHPPMVHTPAVNSALDLSETRRSGRNACSAAGVESG